MMNPADPLAPTRRRIAAFYVLALGISWSVWAPWIASAQAIGGDASWRTLHLLGSLGPCLAALLVMGWTGGRARLRELARGTVTAPAVRAALIWGVLFPAATFIVSAQIMALTSGTTARWDRVGVVAEYPALSRIEYVAASFFFYGIGEEVGWRGFLYPALRRQGRRTLTAALLVVPFWAIWHLPLFFATESYRAMGLGGAVGWLLSLASGSVLTAWLTDRAKGSVLPAAVLHAALDVFFLADVGVPVQSVMGAVVTLWGVVVAVGQFRRPRPASASP
jgi:CAAX protease family protein